MATRQDENKDAKTLALFMTIVTLLMWLPYAAYTFLIFQSNSKEFLSRQEFVHLSFFFKDSISYELACESHHFHNQNSRVQDSSPGYLNVNKDKMLMLFTLMPCNVPCSPVAKGSDLYRADKSIKLCMVVA